MTVSWYTLISPKTSTRLQRQQQGKLLASSTFYFHVAPYLDSFSDSIKQAEDIQVQNKQLIKFRKTMTGRLFGNRDDMIFPKAIMCQMVSPAHEHGNSDNHNLHAYFSRMKQRHS